MTAGFVGRAEAGIVEDALKLREQQIADLLVLAEELLVERVQTDESDALDISRLVRYCTKPRICTLACNYLY